MNTDWFKKQQKIANVTAEDIGLALGRDRSLVSRIYVGRQRMKLEEAKVFATVLSVPLDEVLKQAGVLDEPIASTTKSGFSEGDAAPFDMTGAPGRKAQSIAEAFGQASGVDVWSVKSADLISIGYREGDLIMVDTHQANTVKRGDVVVSQVYDRDFGGATTLIGEYFPPVVIQCSNDPAKRNARVVDGNNVLIRGKVIASWRVA